MKLCRKIVLTGKTYKISVNSNTKLYITINGFDDNPKKPFEIFLNTHSAEHNSELNALSLALSALFRKIDDISFIIPLFEKIHDREGIWWKNENSDTKSIYIHSIPHAIAIALKMFLSDDNDENVLTTAEPKKEKQILYDSNTPESLSNILAEKSFKAKNSESLSSTSTKKSFIAEEFLESFKTENNIDRKCQTNVSSGSLCPQCSQYTLIKKAGCEICENPECFYSKCD